MILFHVIYNSIDFLILRKYLSHFSQKKRARPRVCVIAYVVCVLLLSLINLLAKPNLNLLFSIGCICIYGCTFQLLRNKSLLILGLYIGLGFVAEPIGFLFTQQLTRNAVSFYSSYGVAAMVSLFTRYMIISIICKITDVQIKKMPLNIRIYLLLISVLGILECCIAIWLVAAFQNNVAEIFSFIVIVLVLSINLLAFLMLERYQKLLEEKQQSMLMLREASAKEAYYNEVEESNFQIRKIRHDLKNQLSGIVSNEDEGEMKKRILSIISDLDNVERKIYTANTVINTILNTKLTLAEKHNISCKLSVLVPKKINMDYGDAGILFGNLLDNCIEACLELPQKERWLDVKIIYQTSMLIIKISNSKARDTVRKNFRDNREHGFGQKSVRTIIEKYGGNVEFLDGKDCYEVNAVLYGMKDDKDFNVEKEKKE